MHDVLLTEITRERSYNLDSLNAHVAANRPLLTNDQQQAYRSIMSIVEDARGRIIFLDAPGGTGKTFLLNLILAEVRSRRQVAVALASSGIAATLLDGGRTAHSILKIPLNIGRMENPTLRITKTSGTGMLLRACRLIIWGECTMGHKNSLEALDRTLRDIRDRIQVMGGIVLLLAGDFRQTLPIVRDGTAADELNACLKASILWRTVVSFSLTTNMRARNSGDPDSSAFATRLLQLGNGEYPTLPGGTHVTFTHGLGILVQDVGDLIAKVFPDLPSKYRDLRWLSKRAILAPKNNDIDDVNARILTFVTRGLKAQVSVKSWAQNFFSSNQDTG